MTVVFINPGSGSVHYYGRPLLRHAWKAIRVFRREMDMDDITIERHPDGEDEGRYGFILRRSIPHQKGTSCEVWMPGLPLDGVRYVQRPDQNILNFPRLLIGKWGSSWVWKWAVGSACEELMTTRELRAAERAEASVGTPIGRAAGSHPEVGGSSPSPPTIYTQVTR